MKRSNTFDVAPRSDTDAELLHRVLDASASLWNELNYERRQSYFGDGDVFETDDYRKRYVGVLGSATAQQVIRKNTEAWRSFIALKKKGEAAGPPGYWGNEEDGRELRTYVRNDQYTLVTGERSRVEIPVGKDLKDEYDHTGRLRLEVRGRPKWSGKQGRLEIYHDELSDRFRAIQPVSDCSPRDQPLADETAALDIGANNIVACTTTTGQQYLYEGRELFDRFSEITFDIAERQSKVKRDEGQYSSKRIRHLYRKRTGRRNHAQDALVRDLVERLHEQGVATVYIGALTDVLETSWSVEANAKTHNFWAFRRFIERIGHTAEEYGLSVEVRSEAWTTRTCPNCGSTDDTTRDGDTLTCLCGFDGHADLVASETFLRWNSDAELARPMARPVCLKWNDHSWPEIPHSHESSNEEHTNQSTLHPA